MLTDIFADRYAERTLWERFTESEAKLLNQCYRIVAEQLFPYWVDGKESAWAKSKWTAIYDRLTMELGRLELAPKTYSYETTWNGSKQTVTGTYTLDLVCKQFMCEAFTGQVSPDRFIKERLSFVELAFRERGQDVQNANGEFPAQLQAAQLQDRRVVPGRPQTDYFAEALRRRNQILNEAFQDSLREFNERLRRAGANLNYHNGFIQIANDRLTEVQIEQPFWTIVGAPIWKNVDLDMKEAFDRRDAGDRDPAFYAARALESAIKIISDQKGWTHGGERGAHSYIDNLAAAKNGRFIAPWESDALKAFFTEIRNPFGHGPGSGDMPQLSAQQTMWAIEICMSWTKSLVCRL